MDRKSALVAVTLGIIPPSLYHISSHLGGKFVGQLFQPQPQAYVVVLLAASTLLAPFVATLFLGILLGYRYSDSWLVASIGLSVPTVLLSIVTIITNLGQVPSKDLIGLAGAVLILFLFAVAGGFLGRTISIYRKTSESDT